MAPNNGFGLGAVAVGVGAGVGAGVEAEVETGVKIAGGKNVGTDWDSGRFPTAPCSTDLRDYVHYITLPFVRLAVTWDSTPTIYTSILQQYYSTRDTITKNVATPAKKS